MKDNSYVLTADKQLEGDKRKHLIGFPSLSIFIHNWSIGRVFDSMNFLLFYELYSTLVFFLPLFSMASGVWVVVLTLVVFILTILPL